MDELRKTALYDKHIELNAKMIEYAGYLMPVEYSGLVTEHNAVRENAGMFDVSHMGEIKVTGEDATNYVNYIFTNDINKMEQNQVLYGLMCYEDGGVVDDLLVYKYNEFTYLLVVNAANADKDYEWLLKNKLGFNVDVINVSSRYNEIALQGPSAQIILQKLTTIDLNKIQFFYFDQIEILNHSFLVSRTGYTGEDGFEIYGDIEGINLLWASLISEGVTPCGLGCRDTLRFEANLPLYGNEISSDINPLEAGLGYFVKLDKANFIGLKALKEYKQHGLNRKIIGFELLDKGIPRHGYDVLNSSDEIIGVVTTGYLSPTLNKTVGLALINGGCSTGDEIFIQIRKNKARAIVRDRRFYQKQYRK